MSQLNEENHALVKKEFIYFARSADTYNCNDVCIILHRKE